MYEPEGIAGSESSLRRRRPLQKGFAALGREKISPQFSADSVVEEMNKSLLQSWMGGNWNPNSTLDEMQKALATTNLTGYGNATPLLLENLDQMMTEVLITSAHLKLFQSIPRVPSIQPLYQWIRHQAYGTARRAPGFREGGAPSS